ncbi:hypothetical protein [Desulfuromonas sp. AOP6]|uniref:hypothetical protein n=1 Tax=Desulfuromonas sp. AOP6 TaxID=1566351 RepID=UPI0012844175|nr:hypothetical protein [Desulfuromonas sp. AOP6]BCA80315.1 hypothetical protein AOP6_2102 [Desulfuromonas sp. AOP6]
MKKFFLLLLLFSSPAFAADSTSYAPPGVVQNTTMDRHGTAITNASTVRATGDMRTPILYDSDNTGYYVNPSGASSLSGLYVEGNIVAGRMYDKHNTYYVADPASTSRLNSVQANSMTAASITLGGETKTSWPTGGVFSGDSGNGYYRFPDGFTIMWLTVSVPANSSINAYFPRTVNWLLSYSLGRGKAYAGISIIETDVEVIGVNSSYITLWNYKVGDGGGTSWTVPMKVTILGFT